MPRLPHDFLQLLKSWNTVPPSVTHYLINFKSRSLECKDQESEWAKGDTQCVLQTGSCQFNTVRCTGNGFAYRPEYACGGPAERQCCAPAKSLKSYFFKILGKNYESKLQILVKNP